MTIPAIDLMDPDVFAREEHHGMLAWLRANDPVHWHPGPGNASGFWALTRHAEVVAAARNPALFSSRLGTQIVDRKVEGDLAPTLHHMDPPLHTAYKRLLQPRFLPRAVARLEDAVRQHEASVMSSVADEESFDLVRDVAAPIPLVVIGDLLGVPASDRDRMLDWSNQLATPDEPEFGGAASGDQAREELVDYFRWLCDQRRAVAEDDVISALVHGQIEGRPLTQAEIDSYILFIVVAGNETTRHTICLGMLALMQHPDQCHRVLRGEVEIADEVEEILRWTPTVIAHRRTATQDVTVGDKQIRAGDKVALYWVSANRDESVFERADEFDVGRVRGPQLTFGSGTHFCLGAHLARLELAIAFSLLHERFPSLQQAGEVEWVRSNHLRAIKRMPVRLADRPARVSR